MGGPAVPVRLCPRPLRRFRLAAAWMRATALNSYVKLYSDLIIIYNYIHLYIYNHLHNLMI